MPNLIQIKEHTKYRQKISCIPVSKVWLYYTNFHEIHNCSKVLHGDQINQLTQEINKIQVEAHTSPEV